MICYIEKQEHSRLKQSFTEGMSILHILWLYNNMVAMYLTESKFALDLLSETAGRTVSTVMTKKLEI